MARQSDHQRTEELISAYLDQQVTAEEKQFFERHVAACADCRAQLAATRSMVAALRAMPVVKAPRSFVLPREMARSPRRSIFAWYPALRLATVLAALAFVVLFAGDLLISRSGGNALQMSIPAAAPAPRAEKPAAAMPAPAPTFAAQPGAPAPVANSAVATETGVAAAPPAAPLAASGAAAVSGTVTASDAATAEVAVSQTATMTKSTAALRAVPTATPEMTEVAVARQSAHEATAEPAAGAQADQSARAVEPPAVATTTAPAAPAIEPLRLIEMVLLGLVIVLGAAMLIARRRQT